MKQLVKLVHHQEGDNMEEIFIKREVKKILDIFFQNNYTLNEKRNFINAKRKIAEQIDDKISLEVCKIIEEKLK